MILPMGASATSNGVGVLSSAFSYTFPALRGIQAGHEYFVSMCPLRLVPRLFTFDEAELLPELRAQRVLNRARIPELAGYIVQNPTEYVFSALTVSIDADVEFSSASDNVAHFNIGWLQIPMSARFVINDGQHRRAAIEAALKERPELGDESIATVFFIDRGLSRAQQMFADLNRFAIRPTQSLNILYDHRDPLARLSRDLVRAVDVFADMTELDKSAISNRSRRLFTLSGIHRGTVEFLRGQHLPLDQQGSLATTFWSSVAEHMPEWRQAKLGKVAAADLRRDFIHAHAITLAALGRAGNALLSDCPNDWQQRLVQLERLDWRRGNHALWEGRVTIGGQIAATAANHLLLTNAIKLALDLDLTPEEAAAEAAHAAQKQQTLQGD
jgi:DNA sulfur modification protein DndB